MFRSNTAFRKRNFALLVILRPTPFKNILIHERHHSLVMDRHHKSGKKPDESNAKSMKTLPTVALGFFPP